MIKQIMHRPHSALSRTSKPIAQDTISNHT
jgi:hypothetical protein